jgi:hypothetical protein
MALPKVECIWFCFCFLCDSSCVFLDLPLRVPRAFPAVHLPAGTLILSAKYWCACVQVDYLTTNNSTTPTAAGLIATAAISISAGAAAAVVLAALACCSIAARHQVPRDGGHRGSSTASDSTWRGGISNGMGPGVPPKLLPVLRLRFSSCLFKTQGLALGPLKAAPHGILRKSIIHWATTTRLRCLW